MDVVRAVYENGILRPLQRLDLQEQQTVRLHVLPDETGDTADAAIRMLIASGLLTPPSGRSDAPPLSEEERRELAERMGRAPAKPLSELIIEDRGE